MKKPWQIWSMFAVCLLAVSAAMFWLSLKTIRLDALRETDRAETESARREAELQERISSALYQMDLKMLPLVAQEAARPAEFYRPFYEIVPPNFGVGLSGKSAGSAIGNLRLSSPLLFQSPNYVQLHFEIDAANLITSPKYPRNEELDDAIAAYQISQADLNKTLKQINDAKQLFDYSMLVEKTSIPADLLASTKSAPQDSVNGPGPLTAYHVQAVENFRQAPHTQSALPNASILDMQRSRGDQRINDAFINRQDSIQEFANNNLVNNGYYQWADNTLQAADLGNTNIEPAAPAHPMQPIWLGENLIMARQAMKGQKRIVQCCWLDWKAIKDDLQNEVADLLPDLQFEAVTAETELKTGTALTTIPVQLIIDRPKMLDLLALDSGVGFGGKPAFPIPLLTAWCCFILAVVASALLLHGVIKLSERRAAFVSAVTHELRTPLTTFRMYSEMLADGMVPAEKQQQYANTLKVQADRLGHLVENVLQFARLERGRANVILEAITVGDLLERCGLRLQQRAADSQMQVVIEVTDALSHVSLMIQPATIEQILFNLVDNACKYAQTAEDNRIVLSVEKTGRHLRFQVRDFGPGILPAERKHIFEPFRQSATATENAVSGVGLGLALCQRMADSLGGRLVDTECSSGACFQLELPLND